jgi:DNA-binding CsgD family transcriptional regulator
LRGCADLVVVKALLERAATTMCDLPGLERFMVFQREGGVLRAAATVFADHDEWARDCQALSASTRYAPDSIRMPVDEVDRDILASFAALWGPIVERAILIEHLQLQQRAAEQLARSASGLLRGLGGDILLLESDQPTRTVAPWQSRSEVVSDLTRREYEVLQLMTKGASNREIATTIFLSEETVKSHVKRILQKFGVANRGQAVATYLESLERRPGLGAGPRRGGLAGSR